MQNQLLQGLSIKNVYYPVGSQEVERTAAESFSKRFDLRPPQAVHAPPEGLRVYLASSWPAPLPKDIPADRPWMYVQFTPAGTGHLVASEPALLYALVHLVPEYLAPDQLATLNEGLLLKASFSSNRPLWDTILNQTARTARGFAPEPYIEQLARCGFTQLEVNGLASPTAHEAGVPGEFYSQFYSYGAGLLQFVDSKLTRGLYDVSMVQSNLQRLKKLAALGHKYGLKPGLFCFEPRTLPERFFHRYPTLRGARVDHPLRSHMPRYTLTQDHPVVRDHYRELMQNLMQEVPELAYLSVWTNDSGSGFEHTASLYAGRNGGPYIVREWRTHEQIARAAGESATRWLRVLRDAAAEINPEFEVSLRIESFKAEHDTIVEGMGRGVTLEAPSLLVRGYDLPYRHPIHQDNAGIAGTMFHTHMDPKEGEELAAYRARGVEPRMHYAPSSTFNMEPLLGIPYPRMLYKKLAAMNETGIRHINALGGLLHLERTPYWPNPEVIRAFQLNPQLDISTLLDILAHKWAGQEAAQALVRAWSLTEDALSHMPYLQLFSNFGFVWYRLWIRPFVPDIEAIPPEKRSYYERFMVTMANNPNMNDLGKDVLFELVTATSGAYMADAFDRDVEPRFDQALDHIRQTRDALDAPARHVFIDLETRVKAARCWAITQRNLCRWVQHVYGYLGAGDEAQREDHNEQLQNMINKDLINTRTLLELWTQSPVEFMLVSETGETSYTYGESFGDHLRRKIELTEAYRNRPPFIDPDIIWRIEPKISAHNRFYHLPDAP